MRPWIRAIAFGITLIVLYGTLCYVVETKIVYPDPQHNRIHKIKTAEYETYDYVILGSSHGLPISFDNMDQELESMTNTRILNLATAGGGIVPNRLIYEYFATQLDADAVLYVLDSFAFYDRQWNEDRLKTMSLFERAPFDPALLRLLLSFNVRGWTSAEVTAMYLSGFPKINNPHKFTSIVVEMEAWFDREYQPSESELADRIDRLYPDEIDSQTFDRYLGMFRDLIEAIKANGTEVIAIKPPLPKNFHRRIPKEEQFNERSSRLLEDTEVPFHDFTKTINDQSFYLDTDHLNRKGIQRFFEDSLSEVLTTQQ